jgi:1-acyl-sn-glycerol-3-phosphate acyltransferase
MLETKRKENEPQVPEVGSSFIIETNEPKIGTEPAPEAKEPGSVERQIEKLKEEIEGIIGTGQPTYLNQEGGESRAQKIKEYQEKYLPNHLRGRNGPVAKAITGLWTRMSGKLEGQGGENIPEKGPFIVIGNHFGGGDAEAILDTFKEANLHFAVAKEMWWNSNPVQRWLLKKFGMIPVEESLSNLSEQEKEAALERQGGNGKKVFRKIIDREKAGGTAVNVEFVRQAVALLLRGDAVGIYPEGLWLKPEGAGKLSREHKEMKQGYRVIELIATQYKKITGEDLPIVPTAYTEDAKTKERKLIVGQKLKLSENKSGLNGTDWAMARVAGMLPEWQRGYYKDKVE